MARSKRNLIINLKSTDKEDTLVVPAKLSFQYWENILNFGIGFKIDDKNVKKYRYPKKIYIEKKDSAFKIVKYPTFKKGSPEIVFNFPYCNTFLFKTNSETVRTAGFLGIGLGFNYAYADNHYLSLNTGAAIDFALPFLVPLDRGSGNSESTSSSFISIRNHQRFGHFDLGYGLAFSHSNWSLNQWNDSLTKYTFQSSEYNSLGLSVKASYQFLKTLSVGILYQPNLVNLTSRPRFIYKDFISIETSIKINLNPKK